MTLKSTLLLSTLSLLLLAITPISHANQTTSYSYNSLGLIDTVDGPRTDVTDVTTFAYDTKGNRTTVTNALGHVTQITSYDLSGRPLTIVDANGATTQLTYDVRGRLLSQNTAGRLTTFTYNGVGNVIQISQNNGQVISYHYDDAHRATGYNDAQGNRVEYTLDLAGNQIQEKIYDPSHQLTRSHSFIYDELNRLRADIGADSQTATLDYDTNSNLTDQSDPNGNPTSYAFDGLNRLIKSTDADNGQTHYGYDDRDNLISVTDAKGHTTHYTYDAFNNLIQQDSPDTGITTFTYDEANNRTSQTDANNITRSYGYDALNRLTSISYPNTEFNITYTYDENNSNQHGIGRLTSQIDNSGTTHYAYDIRGNLTNVTTQRDTHTLTLDYRYNNTDQLTQITYPDGRTVDYSYDTAGNISQVTTTDSQAHTQTILSNMHYQPFGPMTSQTLGNGLTANQLIDQDYRQASLSTAGVLERGYGFDANSNIISISDLIDANNSQRFHYDMLNRLTYADNTYYGSIDYHYDAVHNRTQKTTLINALTLNEDYQYAIDSNQLHTKTAGTVTNYHYDANGNITDNGIYQFIYGDDNRLQQVQQNGQTIAFYRYNAQGQRTSKTLTTPTANKTIDYLYSPSGQLLTEISPGQNSQLIQLRQQAAQRQQSIEQLRLDLQQNSQQQQSLQQQVSTLQQQNSQAQNTLTTLQQQASRQQRSLNRTQRIVRLLTRLHTRYLGTRWQQLIQRWLDRYQQRQATQQTQLDQSHATLTQQQQQISHNTDQIRLAQQQVTDLQTQNQNLQQQQQTQQAQLDSLHQQIAQLEQHPTQTHYKQYVYANGTLAAIIENNQIYYVHTDHLGTPHVITEQNQHIVWQATYTPFGQATIITQTLENNIRFPGQYFDQETQLHYNYFRYYDPQTGRYITSDPIGLSGGINTFGYVQGDPLGWIDPFGLAGARRGTTGTPPTMSEVFAQSNVNSLINQIRQYDPSFRYPTVRPTSGPGSRVNGTDVEFLEQTLRDYQASGVCATKSVAKPRTNKLGPNPKAEGPHTQFKTDPKTGKVTGYTEFDAAGNTVKRFRGQGKPHGGTEPPFILEPKPGKGPGAPPKVPRQPRPDELPRGY